MNKFRLLEVYVTNLMLPLRERPQRNKGTRQFRYFAPKKDFKRASNKCLIFKDGEQNKHNFTVHTFQMITLLSFKRSLIFFFILKDNYS